MLSIKPTRALSSSNEAEIILETEAVSKIREEISDLEKQLDEHKSEICKILGLLTFNYSTVSGLEYLVEVKNVTSVPPTWSKVSGTLKVSRYRTQKIDELLPKLEWAREKLTSEAKKGWIDYLIKAVPKLRMLLTSVKSWAKLDVLVTMALIGQRDGFCRPQFNSNGVYEVKNGRNLVVEEAIMAKAGLQFVPNDINLASGMALILTGPNMGGKSCYLR